jgi:hypothetical protein
MWGVILMCVLVFIAGVLVGQMDTFCKVDPQVKMRLAP